MGDAASDRQAAFANAVLNAEAATPGTLSGKSGQSLSRRFDVYRNNVYASLIDALADRFPATGRLVGDEFFRATARAFVQEQPPRSPVLLAYGKSFGDFIAEFPPAAPVPYLADVARLEWAWHEAYHAADAEPLSPSELGATGPDVAQSTLTLHPSVSVVSSTYPVVTIWQLSMREGEDEPARLPADGEDALVLRPRLEVEVRRLPIGGATFVRALQRGVTLEAAATAALSDAPSFDLQANLAGLMSSGAITHIR